MDQFASNNFLHLRVLEIFFHELLCQHMANFFNISPIASHLHPLNFEDYDFDSRLVVNDDLNGKFRFKMAAPLNLVFLSSSFSPEN